MLWYDFTRCLAYNYNISQFFFCSHKLIGREVLAYKLLCLGKQHMSYLFLDVEGLDLKFNIKSLKPVYIPGFYTLNVDYSVSFDRNYIFMVYRFINLFTLIFIFYMNIMFALIFHLRVLEFFWDIVSFFFFYNEKKKFLFKYMFIRKLMLLRRKKRRRWLIRRFLKGKLRRLRRSLYIKGRTHIPFVLKYAKRKIGWRLYKKLYRYNRKRRKILKMHRRLRLVRRLKFLLRFKN